MGGVLVSKAPSTTFVGGRAFVEMMIPGARDGSLGLRDQIAKEIVESDEGSGGAEDGSPKR